MLRQSGVSRRRASPNVLEVRKPIDELAAQQIEIAVTAEIGEIGRRNNMPREKPSEFASFSDPTRNIPSTALP